MNVDDVVAEKIAAARARIEANKRRRAALAAARQRGLAHRHAAKLRNLSVRATDGFVGDAPSPTNDTEENPVSAHLRLVSSTAEPDQGRGMGWTAIHEGARFAEQIVRDAHAAGLCVSCYQVNGEDPRHCWGGGCRNQTTRTNPKETP